MSRKEVLKAFKALHRITQATFEGDTRALMEARQKINSEFRKDFQEEEIPEKLKIAKDVGDILKHQVVQLSKKQDANNFGKKTTNFCRKFLEIFSSFSSSFLNFPQKFPSRIKA
jgi:hypothetical protein